MDPLLKRQRTLLRAAIPTGNGDIYQEADDNQRIEWPGRQLSRWEYAEGADLHRIFTGLGDMLMQRSSEDRKMSDAMTDHSRQMNDGDSRSEQQHGVDQFEQHERRDKESGTDTKIA